MEEDRNHDVALLDRESYPRLGELQLWLRSLIFKPDFFTAEPLHELATLHHALYLAVIEIAQTLDSQMQAVIDAAGEIHHGISLDEDEFSTERKLDIDSLHEEGKDIIELMSREKVIWLLSLARDEIEWEENEIRRLEMHCDNARMLKDQKLRTNFQYRFTPRKERIPPPALELERQWEAVNRARGKTIHNASDDSEEDRERKFVYHTTTSARHDVFNDVDEEMLEAGGSPEEKQRTRNDSVSPAASWGRMKI